MDEILNLNPSEMAGVSFKCSCGRTHSVGIQKIIIGKNITDKMVEILSPFKQGKVFLMDDNNTHEVYGQKVEVLLKREGYQYKRHKFETRQPLVPDEKAIGRLIVEIEKETALIISVGSGSLNDLARIISFKLNIPYIIIGTAPSMDGYASTVSPLIIDGFKITYEAVYPYAILADTEVLKNAPMEMIHAGFGDILGKVTALADWELSQKNNNEYYCETSVKLVRNALKKCIDNIDGMVKRDETAIQYVMEGLILSGVAMGLVGNSRPASGAEHHLSHYWEMDTLARGAEHLLHGNSVGTACVVMASIYTMLRQKLSLDIVLQSPEELQSYLIRAGAAETPAKLGISRELFRQSILYAKEVRPRYTALSLAAEQGLLEDYAEILTDRFYGK